MRIEYPKLPYSRESEPNFKIMTTKVFLHDEQQAGAKVKHCWISFLKARYENSDYLETFCRLKFQAGGLESGNMDWYAMEMTCESDKPEDFIQAAKILKEIKENTDRHDPQPKEILLILGAIEHVRYKGGYIPRSYHGMKLFNVMDGTSLYTRIYAATEALANKELNKRKYNGMELKFDCVVEI